MTAHAPPDPDAARRQPAWWPLAAGALFYAALIGVGYASIRGVLGEMDPCFSPTDGSDLCYCETLRAGLVKQPANTASNLSFALVGFAVLADVAFSSPAPINRFTRGRLYGAWYGLLTLWIGPASMVFHASYTYWAGVLDGIAMYVWVSFVLVYNAVRLLGWSPGRAMVVWAAINACWSVLRVVLPNEGRAVSTSTLLFLGLLAPMLVSFVAVVVFGRERPALRPYAWLGASIVSFSGGLVVWLNSGTGERLCSPDSLLQGHALWHVSAAAAVATLYVYLRRSPDHLGRPSPRNA